MSNYEHGEALIARHKALTQELMDTGSQAVAIELIRVSMQLAKRGFTLTEDEADWLAGTVYAGCGVNAQQTN